MSTYKINELPPICHHIHKVILAADIERWHLSTVRQALDPMQAREMAIMWSHQPMDYLQKKMVEDAYRTVIRLYFAFDGLGITYEKGRRITADNLVTMGLRSGNSG